MRCHRWLAALQRQRWRVTWRRVRLRGANRCWSVPRGVGGGYLLRWRTAQGWDRRGGGEGLIGTAPPPVWPLGAAPSFPMDTPPGWRISLNLSLEEPSVWERNRGPSQEWADSCATAVVAVPEWPLGADSLPTPVGGFELGVSSPSSYKPPPPTTRLHRAPPSAASSCSQPPPLPATGGCSPPPA